MFAAPLALLGLVALPGILLLLRLNPPPARRIAFPPMALLRNLPAAQTTPRGIPLWLLILRIAAATLVILGLAAPSLHQPPALPGDGPVLLVIDNGWASAADWQQRHDAAASLITAAARAGRDIAILATAGDAAGTAPRITGVMTGDAAVQIINAMQPEPWPPDRTADSIALRGAPERTRIYLADGITDGAGFADFLKILSPTRTLAGPNLPPLLLPPHLGPDGSLIVHLDNPPENARLTATNANGEILASAGFSATGDAAITLPLPIAARITALSLQGPQTAGGTVLLDGTMHAALVGLAAGSNTADLPFLGPLYYIRRALPPGSQVFSGDLASLIGAKVNLIVLADLPLTPPQQVIVRSYIAQGGIVIRFAGPITSADPDPVTPDPLLPGDRRLGGALTWASPESIAPFPPDTAFAGLETDPAVTVSRQILADPTRLAPATIWASLTDGTPLVLGTRIGKGYLISFLTTANADWSNLALYGLFPAMLDRLAGLAEGGAPRPGLVLPLGSALSAFGTLSPATGSIAIPAGRLATTVISPAAPPGLYGEGGVSLALNLGGHIPPPQAAVLPDATPFTGPAAVNFGPPMIAAALLLLTFDLAISLLRRGLLAIPRLAVLALVLLPLAGHAQSAALQPTLGYLQSDDPATDQMVDDALSYLSAEVSAHTSAQLAAPVGLDPAVDDLSLFPLIYWLIRPDTPAPAPAACAALTSYMSHGGLLVIDTVGGDSGDAGSGAAFSPGTDAALARATACLVLPPLSPLSPADVLAHCFYIIDDFPGRFAGAPVLIAAPAARDADGVTPVIVSQNDWAGAWARDANGTPEQTPIPGGDDQRVIADRFGTNLVIYALTGSYKADQTDVPALLDKLGQ